MNARCMKILLIDDDEDGYILTRSLLGQVEGTTFELEWVNTYEAGLERILQGEHDAYLVDYRLGLRDGLELMNQAIAGGCRLPIIIFTGHSDHAIDVQAMKEGAADYLLKERAGSAAIDRSLRYAIERFRSLDQRLKHEAQLRILTEQMPAVLWTTDGHLRFTSSWGAGLLGLNLRPNELVGRTLFDYFETEDEDHEVIHAHSCALRGESISLKVDWMGRTYRACINPLREGGGPVVGTVGIALDITDAMQVEDELSAARRIQERMFPKEVPPLPGFDLAGVCHPAAATGGDYYDFIPMRCGSLGIVVADVSRHGFASALIMATTRRLIRTLIETTSDVSAVLSAANRAVAEDTASDYFVTLFYACLNPKTRALGYAAAGHEAYVLDPTKPPQKLESTALPLGVDETAPIPCGSPLTLAPGQLLLLFTDGVNEAAAANDTLFGIPRVLETVQSHRNRSAAEIVAILYRAVRDFCHPAAPKDDLTIVVLKVGGE